MVSSDDPFPKHSDHPNITNGFPTETSPLSFSNSKAQSKQRTSKNRSSRVSSFAESEDEEYDSDPASDNEEDSDDGDERCWPTDAWHGEDAFEYTFDAGEHRIYRYAFKENPDTSVVPEYGDATREENDNYW